jgi:hypothetical protein
VLIYADIVDIHFDRGAISGEGGDTLEVLVVSSIYLGVLLVHRQAREEATYC